VVEDNWNQITGSNESYDYNYRNYNRHEFNLRLLTENDVKATLNGTKKSLCVLVEVKKDNSLTNSTLIAPSYTFVSKAEGENDKFRVSMQPEKNTKVNA
jgi:hypothetical protein